MTLSFTQTINGKPNYFIEKIWLGLESLIAHGDYDYVPESISTWEYYLSKYVAQFGISWDEFYSEPNPKLHTIREDKSNRWKAGMDIHMVINNRTPNRFQFAPVIKCKSVQTIEIKYIHVPFLKGTYLMKGVHVFIDSVKINNADMLKLAINDGFDSVEDFFAYFNKDFTGKIIHWTDLKY